MKLATGHFGHPSIAILAVFLSNAYNTGACHLFLALLCFLFSKPECVCYQTSRLILQSPIAKSEDEHLFPCSKINFSSLLLRETSRITPISRGFDGSLLRGLRTCENKNIAFLGREVDATLFSRLRKENFRKIFAKCPPSSFQI